MTVVLPTDNFCKSRASTFREAFFGIDTPELVYEALEAPELGEIRHSSVSRHVLNRRHKVCYV